ncbi:DUF1801 domain-containing protein [Chryseobacterium sp. CBSDS_008]|uniref:DUF1801 domain-containing protein n=1 Tax=Chryseobacterium sp. CBSDS_008 TaxID=3415265 RepID=UPI003CF3E857
MTIQEQIQDYINSQPESKRHDMHELQQIILKLMPDCQLWFSDGKDSENKTVSNPNIGYGSYTMEYTGGKTRDFYQIGMSANTTGISIYVMNINDKTHLSKTYGDTIGRASVTGYCIKFKSMKDINTDILKAAILDGLKE